MKSFNVNLRRLTSFIACIRLFLIAILVLLIGCGGPKHRVQSYGMGYSSILIAESDYLVGMNVSIDFVEFDTGGMSVADTVGPIVIFPQTELKHASTSSGIAEIDSHGVWTTTKKQVMRQGEVHLLHSDGTSFKIIEHFSPGSKTFYRSVTCADYTKLVVDKLKMNKDFIAKMQQVGR